MPPNRKSNLAASDFASFSKSQLQTLKAPVVVATPPPSDSANYWDWPADEEIRKQQQAEQIRDLFSVERIEANLVRAAQRLEAQQTTKETVVTNARSSSDDYWHVPSDDIAVNEEASARHHPAPASTMKRINSYWKEQPHRLTESDQYWDDPAASHQAPMEGYWDDCSAETPAVERERWLQVALEHRRARQLTSAAFYEQQLVRSVAQNNNHHHAAALNPAHDAYWVC